MFIEPPTGKKLLFPKFPEKRMLKLILKHFKNLTKNDEPFYPKNAQLKVLNLW